MHKLIIILLILSICYYSHTNIGSEKESYENPTTKTIDNPFNGGNYNISETTYSINSNFINPSQDKNILSTSITVDGVPILNTEKQSL